MLKFAKPPKQPKKANREQHPHYVWWIHGWQCCVPGCVTPWPVHAHHVVRKSQLGSDRTCVPLCMNHHVGLHGIHNKGVLEFEKIFRINLLQKTVWFQEAYENKISGPNQDLLPVFGKHILRES